MPKCKDREYREFDARQLELRKLEDGQDVVEGYATTFGEPYLLWDDGDYRMFESVDAHAYDDCDMSDVIMQYNHEGRVFARGGNKTLEVKPDSHGLHIRTVPDLNQNDLARMRCNGRHIVCLLAQLNAIQSGIKTRDQIGVGFFKEDQLFRARRLRIQDRLIECAQFGSGRGRIRFLAAAAAHGCQYQQRQ
jgi:hypothetical protein